ncbi:hypothetical protein [Tepidimicrobium xylanilyticum]|uniref:Uncharacterized protein n=1 Tax=Tepidimicrobium xylanilyticum TaxID=1123352 RepID=A0A1H3EI37_9FIRM|nr:hypothetical protein [Tepidimicrobium xylanilyticum]GMG96239.1 hypothetical protein EN5CB1_10650 [Tepidimicrobium xylanilyticum]SDX78280.1 hypothetical protein SAMN05660923_02920 [Tepidimicrobium xylanilyticum]
MSKTIIDDIHELIDLSKDELDETFGILVLPYLDGGRFDYRDIVEVSFFIIVDESIEKNKKS